MLPRRPLNVFASASRHVSGKVVGLALAVLLTLSVLFLASSLTGQAAPLLPTPIAVQIGYSSPAQAIEAALEQYQWRYNLIGPVTVSELTVEGEWAYAMVHPQAGNGELLYMLAHRGLDEIWQVLVPDAGGLYLTWINAMPSTLLSDSKKSRLLSEVTEANSLWLSPATDVGLLSLVSIPYISQYQGQSTQNHDCGPASGAMVLQAYEKRPVGLTDQQWVVQVRSHSGNSSGNLNFSQLEAAISWYGVSSTEIPPTLSPAPDAQIQEMKNALAANKPVIALVHGATLGRGTNYGDHFVVVRGFSDDNQYVYVNDPDYRCLFGWLECGGEVTWSYSHFRQACYDAQYGPYGIIVGNGLGGGCSDVADVGENSSRQQQFVDAYDRNGGKASLGCTENGAHWWDNGAVIQDFTGSSTFGDVVIVQDETNDDPVGTIPAYVVHGGILGKYFEPGNSINYGPPTSDEFTNQQGLPQSNFAHGYVTWEGGAVWHTWPTSFSQWKAEYYNNMNLVGYPTMVRNESSPNHDWQWSAPDDGKIGVFADEFSVRWTRTLNFAEGYYHFSTFSDDGVRVWVDGTRIINSWVSGGGQTHTGDIQLSSGNHTIKIEYFEDGGLAYFDISWEQTDPPSQVTMAIDSPAGGADVEGVVTVGGWAIDRASSSGTGVSQVHVYRDGTAGGGGVGLGVASYGGDRSDVAAVYGSQFRYSGYNFSWNSNTASLGNHTLYVYVYSTVSSSWSHYQRQVHVVDTTPPSQASSLRPNGWTGPYTSDNTPAFAWDSASDARGIAGYYIALDDWTPDGGYGNDWAIDNVTSWAVPDSAPLADGSHFVAITSRDNTGLVNPTNTNTQGDAPYYEFIVDTVAPASTVATLPGTTTDPTFALTWSGSDGGSGVTAYDVQVRDGSDGTWQYWLVGTTKTSTTFTGQAGHTYYFRCRAYDLAGNVEGWPNDDGDTYTCVKGSQIFLPVILRRATFMPEQTPTPEPPFDR